MRPGLWVWSEPLPNSSILQHGEKCRLGPIPVLPRFRLNTRSHQTGTPSNTHDTSRVGLSRVAVANVRCAGGWAIMYFVFTETRVSYPKISQLHTPASSHPPGDTIDSSLVHRSECGVSAVANVQDRGKGRKSRFGGGFVPAASPWRTRGHVQHRISPFVDKPRLSSNSTFDQLTLCTSVTCLFHGDTVTYGRLRTVQRCSSTSKPVSSLGRPSTSTWGRIRNCSLRDAL